MTAPAEPTPSEKTGDLHPDAAAFLRSTHTPVDRSLPTLPTPEASPAEERAALERALAGDRAALQGLLRRHLPPLTGLARRLLGAAADRTDDLVQETLIAACKGLAGFRGDSSVRTWLFRILVRLASDPKRWRGVPHAGGDLDLATIPDRCEVDPEQLTLARELRDRIEEAMERLPGRQRAAIHLRAAEGLGYASIGQVLGCSEGAARMLVLSARTNLRARLGDYLEGGR